MNIPRIVIAGTNSGCGKTTLSMGIMAALVEKGRKVQPYKVGPDYIDPMFHTFITGRKSRNLDSWMLPKDTVRHLFAHNSVGADIAVIEGVMGMYDGFGGRSLEGSTADVAHIIGAPVILVINGEAMSLSAAALVKGFMEFVPNANVKGVLINRVSGEAHYKLVKEIIEEHTGAAVVGYLPPMDELAIASRHLGLVTSDEIPDLNEKVAVLSRQIQETVDLECLISIAGEAGKMEEMYPGPVIKRQERARIAVARDKGFCFYYEDNLELLERMGAEIVFFSPIHDSRLPDHIHGLYIGGGYPEVWAEELQNNISMRMDIRRHIEKGLPTYAECGGLMYLAQSIRNREGMEFEMVGVIPGKSIMTSTLKRFGYIFVTMAEDTLLAERGFEIRAHEFHYSETHGGDGWKACFEVQKRKEDRIIQSWHCGYKMHNLMAGYPHLHFWANLKVAENFIRHCILYKEKTQGGIQ